MISIGLTMLITLSLVVIIVVPRVKATRFDIQITWSQLYLTDSYDNDNKGRFEVQIKYFSDSVWKKKDSPSFSCTIIEPFNQLYPKKTFTIVNVEANTKLYFRLFEVDFLGKNDQIIGSFNEDSGGRINDGVWLNYVFLYAGFSIIGNEDGVYAENSAGDWFTLFIVNLGYYQNNL